MSDEKIKPNAAENKFTNPPPLDPVMEDYFKTHDLPKAVMPSNPIQKVLKGQKALVTGANSGIGESVALALAHAGADVVVNYVTHPETADYVVQQIKSHGTNAYAHQCDVSKEDQVQAMIRKMCDTFGTIDILVNNAGIQMDAPIDQMTLAQWQTVLNINLTGQFLCSREAIREFKRRGVREEISCAAGKIICMSSVHDVIPWAGHVNYATSKGGIQMMMKSIAQEVASQRIRVNAVAPGAIRTPINLEAWSTPEAYHALMKLVPYKRIGEPEDIGRAVIWLASDDSDYVHGTTIYCGRRNDTLSGL